MPLNPQERTFTTTTFWNLNMVTFEQIWQVLYDNGASTKKEEGTRRFWATLSLEEQEYAFTTISAKVQEGRFVQYDPIRAIKENIRWLKKAEPDFLSGADQDRLSAQGIPMVQVHYNGTYKICTRQTALDFHLPITIDPW